MLLTGGDSVQSVVNELSVSKRAFEELMRRVQRPVSLGDNVLPKVQLGPIGSVSKLPTV